MGRVLYFAGKRDVNASLPGEAEGMTGEDVIEYLRGLVFARQSLRRDGRDKAIRGCGNASNADLLEDYLESTGHRTLGRKVDRKYGIEISSIFNSDLIQLIAGWTPLKVDGSPDFYLLLLQTYRHRLNMA